MISTPLIKSLFCGVETISCVYGLPVSRVYDMVDNGTYLWVWNVSSGSDKRELRFWSREINEPAAVVRLTLDEAVRAIIPRRSHLPGQFNGLRAWEFRHMLRLSKPSLVALHRELDVRGAVRHYVIPRAKIEEFFRRRWMGNLTDNRAKPPHEPAIPVLLP